MLSRRRMRLNVFPSPIVKECDTLGIAYYAILFGSIMVAHIERVGKKVI
jgi:hypothetical protein